MELVRLVEHQATLSSYRATQHEDRAVQLELLIESTKPKNRYAEWHPLIATPFRYPPPHRSARFRPAYGRNVFYGSLLEETALYEHAYHFMYQRLHLEVGTETGIRTIFFVDAQHEQALHIKNIDNYASIINKHDYAASHEFIITNPDVDFIVYPSCRDPQQRDNAAVLDIHLLEKTPTWESSIKFFYDNTQQKITWLDYHLTIQWLEVTNQF